MILSNINKKILILFLTLNIMNSISWISIVTIIGNFGKIILTFAAIIYFLMNNDNKILKIRNLLFFSIFFSSIMIFSLLFYYNNNLSFFLSMFKSIMFLLYIIFIYLLIKSFLLSNIANCKENIKDLVLFDILRILRNTLIINTIFWTMMAILFNQNLYDVDPTGGRAGFAGFTGDRMIFGLLIATIYLSSFAMIVNKKEIKLNLYIMIFSILLILYSDSRTALSIIMIPSLFYFLKNKLKYLDFFIVIGSIIFIFYIFNNLNLSNVDQYSSGRVLVWSLFFKEIFPDNLITGYGLFNFNDFILNKYMHLSYYFNRIEFLYFHSSYIEIWAAGGILSILSYIILLYKTYLISTNINKSLLLGILVGSFFESFIVSPIFPISSLFWILLLFENINFKKGIK